MTWRGADSAAINVTQRDVVASMLASGIGLEETVRTVLDATHACVSAEPEAAKWDWQEEEKAIWQSGLNFIAKDPDRLGVLVPDNMREAFDVAVTNRKKPSAVFRKDAGWHIRGYTPTLVAGTDVPMSNAVGVIGNAPAHKPEPPPKKFSICPFVPFDLASLPPRQWLYGKHYQRRTVSATIAPGGFGKTTLGMVEAVAMATCRNLLEEQPTDRLRVWYHNGEDNIEELNRRLGAICLHYKIPQEELRGWFFMTSGNEVPLRVANGYSDLRIDKPLIKCIEEEIACNEIDVALLDPLITLHGVSEQDNSKMDTVVRIFASIADAENCAIGLAHHTRKQPAGATTDYGADDMRGASATRDAVRAARMLNQMGAKEAGEVGIQEHDRTSYFCRRRILARKQPGRHDTNTVSVGQIDGDEPAPHRLFRRCVVPLQRGNKTCGHALEYRPRPLPWRPSD